MAEGSQELTSYVSLVPPESRAAMGERDWLTKVCRIGQGHACCRYVTCGAGGFDCAKHSELRALLDSRVSSRTMNARGDNCPGLGGVPADQGTLVQ